MPKRKPPPPRAFPAREQLRLPTSSNAADLQAGRRAVLGVRFDKRTIDAIDKLAADEQKASGSWRRNGRSYYVQVAVHEFLKSKGVRLYP